MNPLRGKKSVLGTAITCGTGNPVDWTDRFGALAASVRDPRLRDYYRQPPVPKNTPIRATPMLSLDIETSGLDNGRDVILSIGLITLRHERIQCAGAKYWIVRPESVLEETAASIHGITHTELMRARRFGDYFSALLEAMAGKLIVAHCADIERRFLEAASLKLTGDPLLFPVIDTMRLEEKHYPRNYFQRLLPWFFRRKRPSLRLDAARQRYGLPFYPPHHALTDALATAELLLAQLQVHYTPRVPISQIWS